MSVTRSVVGTLTRTEAFLAGKTAYAFQAILSELGLSRAALDYDWDDVEDAMQVWLAEGSLNGVDMEIRRRGTMTVLACFEVDIVYDSGQATMRHDAETARLAAPPPARARAVALGPGDRPGCPPSAEDLPA